MQWQAEASSLGFNAGDVDFSGMEGTFQDEEDDEDASTAPDEVITADDDRGATDLCGGMCAESSGATSSKRCAQRCEAAMFDCLELSRPVVADGLLRFRTCERVVVRRAQAAAGADLKGPIVEADCDAVCVLGGNATCASGCKQELRRCAAGSSSCQHLVLSKFVSAAAHKPDYEMKAELNFVHRFARPALSPMRSAMSKLNAMDTASELGGLGKLCDGVCGDAKKGGPPPPRCAAACKADMAKCMDHADETSVEGAEEHDQCTKSVVRAHIA